MTNSLKSKLVTVLATLLIVALFATGFAFNASSSSAETTYFAINEGAAIKIDYENDAENNLTGIRFTGTVKKELSALILADAEGDAEVGMAVMPKAVYDAFGTREQGESDDLFKYIEEEFGKSKDAIAKPYAKGLLSTTEDVEVSGRIIKILDANYNLTYRAVMYYTLDGVNYNYSDYSGDRSLIQVANAALEAGVDAEEIAPIANIIKKSLYLKDGGSLDGNALAIDLGIINASVDLSEKFSAITADDFAFSIKSGSEYVTLTDGIVSPKTTGVGTAVITATAFDGALSFDVSVSVLNTEDGELASFNSDLYEGMAVLATPNPAADAVGQEITSQEYLETYAGEASVLKINVTSGVDKQNLGHNFNVIKVKLPKAHGTNGYTLKMMIENAKYSTSGGTLFFCSSAGTQESNGNNRYVSFTGEGAKTSGVWYEIYVPATEASEYIYIAYHQGWAGGSTNYSIALSWVKDGLVISPEEGELASFNSSLYEGMASLATPDPAENAMEQAITSQEYLETYKGEASVLKINVRSGYSRNGAGHVHNLIKVKLPKAHGTSGYTLKMMLENDKFPTDVGGARFYFGSALSTEVSDTTNRWLTFESGTGKVSGVWYEIYVPATEASDYIYIGYNQGSCGDTNYSIALSYVKDGLVISPEEGELASFNSGLYEGMASLATPNPAGNAKGQAITSQEYHETYKDEASVLKINIQSGVDVNDIGHNYNVIKVKLPKAHGTNGYTVKFMLENDKFGTVGVGDGATSGQFFFCSSSDNRYVTFTGESTKKSGVWYEIYVPATEASEYIYIAYHQARAGGSTNYSIALSWVKDGLVISTDGDELASFNSSLYEGMASLATPNPAGNAKGQAITSQEYHETYKGESSVLKINIQSGVDVNDIGHNYNVIKVKLPKAHGTNGYTIKFMLENDKFGTVGVGDGATSGQFFFCSSSDNRYATFTGEGEKTSGVWYEIYVPATEASEYIYIAYHQARAGGSTNYSIALSWVADGDVTNA